MYDLWLKTTPTAPNMIGRETLKSLKGDIKSAVTTELENDDIVSPKAGEMIKAVIMKHHGIFLEKQVPIQQDAFFHSTVKTPSETYLSYTSRKHSALTKLEKNLDLTCEHCNKRQSGLPKEISGWQLFKDAHVSKGEKEIVHTWTSGKYLYPEIQSALRKLDHPDHSYRAKSSRTFAEVCDYTGDDGDDRIAASSATTSLPAAQPMANDDDAGQITDMCCVFVAMATQYGEELINDFDEMS